MQRYDVRGRLERIVRWQASRVPVAQRDIDRAIDNRVARAGARAAELRKWYRDAPAAEAFPFYDQLYVDRQMHLWVRAYDESGEAAERLWFVFDPDGRAVTQVRLPAELRLLEVDEDSLLAVHTDDLGVEHVQLWRMDHPIRTP